MSMGFTQREYTRREFVKLTGKGLTGVALSSSMLSLLNCTLAQAESGAVDVIATPDFLLAVNKAKCTGCQRCELNCTLANNGKAQPWLSRIHMRDQFSYGEKLDAANYAQGDGQYGSWAFGPETCKQCADPACMKACPVQAIYADEKNGTRMVDEEKCVGCGACAAACPWGMPRIDPETHKSNKCVSCGACVAGCPTSALTMISWEDVAAALAK